MFGSPWATFLIAAPVLLFFGLLVLLVLQTEHTMSTTLFPKVQSLLATIAAISGFGSAASAQSVDVSWYPPAQSQINRNFTQLLHSEGTWGFIYDSSETPDGEYGTYNWCNMPHVRKTEYVKPSHEYELQYVELIHRHHKRTPYSSNAFPVEPYRWDCDEQGLFYYGESLDGTQHSARTYWKVYISPVNPFVPSGWIGTCQFPQITTEGLDDSYVHGADLFQVYHDLLGFLPGRDDEDWPTKVKYRVTNNQITSQVAGLLIRGMWGDAAADRIGLAIQASAVDSLEPRYSCPAGSSLFNRIRSRDNPRWAAHLRAAGDLYTVLDDLAGVPADNEGFHASFDPYYDNLSARQCHGKPLPCKLLVEGDGDGDGDQDQDQDEDPGQQQCITQDLADTVYRIGNWEYSHIYRDSPETLAASAATYGVWLAELAAHLRDVVDGRRHDDDDDDNGNAIYYHNIAHDGSVSRLLSFLQLDTMVWPGMGAEVVFELYRKRTGDAAPSSSVSSSPAPTSGCCGGSRPSARTTRRENESESGWYVRVLFGGQLFKSSSPTLGLLDMIPIETLLAYFDGLVGENASLVKENCGFR
ncbi:phosphoglycerate mutase-like protein [Sodiomyces alkalinus F11]|uniref:Phosphoglycerate mutase-like protein n=1 Tax=Sodiomyces alkalinus (strain CBS 110278 / VKM F-3762 / F11) TaxID=1314773 RepID=A0A3N2Q0P9_SODAK|nr:phosphoglycerate mutase-like protein [Sodiomyces alkalinus F11]ROT40322.1 phosphoglycerate mutase-like protein [Sodiomyces alkalinus F11]